MPKEQNQSSGGENLEDQTNNIDDLTPDSASTNAIFAFNGENLDTVLVADTVASDSSELDSSGIAREMPRELCHSENLEDVGVDGEAKEMATVQESEIQVNHGRPVYEFPNLMPKTSRETLLFDDNEQCLTIPDCISDDALNDKNENGYASTSRESTRQLNSVYQDNNISENMIFQNHSKSRVMDPSMQVHEYLKEKYNIEDNGVQESTNELMQEASGQNGNEIILKEPCLKAPVQNTVEYTSPSIAEVPETGSDTKLQKANIPASNSKANPLKIKQKVSNKKNKCGVCSVRLGICAIRCRCGNLYCGKHRYDRDHNCTFDYRAMGAEEIRKNNPQVVAEKIRKL